MRWSSDFPKYSASPLRQFAAVVLAALWLSAALPAQLSAAEPKPNRAARAKANEIAARAETAHEQGRFGEAAKLYVEALENDPTVVIWLASAAKSYKEAEMFDKAAEFYGKYIAAPGVPQKNIEIAHARLAEVEELRRARRLELARIRADEEERQRQERLEKARARAQERAVEQAAKQARDRRDSIWKSGNNETVGHVEASTDASPYFLVGGCLAAFSGILVGSFALADSWNLDAQIGPGAAAPIRSISFDQATADAASINHRLAIAGILGIAGGIGLTIGIVKASGDPSSTAALTVVPSIGGAQAAFNWRF